MKRTCYHCKIEKNIDAFAWKIKNKTRQYRCKECQKIISKEYYFNNINDQKSKSLERNRIRRSENVSKVFQYLLSHPCVDCGESNPVILEFDHFENKKVAVAQLLTESTWSKVEQEIKKCDVRCANCHRLKTAKDFNYKIYQLWLDRSKQV